MAATFAWVALEDGGWFVEVLTSDRGYPPVVAPYPAAYTGACGNQMTRQVALVVS
jgi:hypothetical protein